MAVTRGWCRCEDSRVVDFDEVLSQLRRRDDAGSVAAVRIVDERGAQWDSAQPQSVRVSTELREWASEPARYSAHENHEYPGREVLVAALSSTAHDRVDTVTLRYVNPVPRVFTIYLAPGTEDVIGCLGVVALPTPSPPVYERTEVPDTLDAALSLYAAEGMEITVRRHLDATDGETVFAQFRRRSGVAYLNAEVTVLQAAAVTYTTPRRDPNQSYEGVLAILDVVQGHHARVEHLMLITPRGIPVRDSIRTWLYAPAA
jgi:hypothetical protein